MLQLSSLLCKAKGIPLYNLSFDKSYEILYELTMHSLDRDSQLFENDVTDEMFAITHDIILLDLSGAQDMSIVRTGTVRIVYLCRTVGGEYSINLAKSIWNLLGNCPWWQCSIRLGTMNTNRNINVLNP